MYDPGFQQKLAALPKEQRKAYEAALDQLSSEVGKTGIHSEKSIEMLFSTRPKLSIAYNEELLKIARKVDERYAQGIAIGELSLAYARLGDLRQAISYFEQHLEIAREFGERQWVASDLNNLANAHLKLGYGSKAIGYYEQSLATAREANDMNWVATQSFNIASVYKDQGNFERALPMLQQAVEIWKKNGNPLLKQAVRMMKEIQKEIKGQTTDKPYEEVTKMMKARDLAIGFFGWSILGNIWIILGAKLDISATLLSYSIWFLYLATVIITVAFFAKKRIWIGIGIVAAVIVHYVLPITMPLLGG